MTTRCIYVRFQSLSVLTLFQNGAEKTSRGCNCFFLSCWSSRWVVTLSLIGSVNHPSRPTQPLLQKPYHLWVCKPRNDESIGSELKIYLTLASLSLFVRVILCLFIFLLSLLYFLIIFSFLFIDLIFPFSICLFLSPRSSHSLFPLHPPPHSPLLSHHFLFPFHPSHFSFLSFPSPLRFLQSLIHALVTLRQDRGLKFQPSRSFQTPILTALPSESWVRVVFLNIITPRHTSDTAFVLAWGISRGSCMTWMVVLFSLCTMRLKNHSLQPDYFPLWPLEMTVVRVKSVYEYVPLRFTRLPVRRFLSTVH